MIFFFLSLNFHPLILSGGSILNPCDDMVARDLHATDFINLLTIVSF